MKKHVESLAYVHNVTCNICTHLIGVIILPLLAMPIVQLLSEPRLVGVTGLDCLMVGTFSLNVEFCLMISVLYYLNRSRLMDVGQFWLGMDLLGILIVTEGTRLPSHPKGVGD